MFALWLMIAMMDVMTHNEICLKHKPGNIFQFQFMSANSTQVESCNAYAYVCENK